MIFPSGPCSGLWYLIFFRGFTDFSDVFGCSFDEPLGLERSFRLGVFEEGAESPNEFAPVCLAQIEFFLLQLQRRFMVFHVSNKFDSCQVLLDAGAAVESALQHPDDLGLQPFLSFLYYSLGDPLLAPTLSAIAVAADAAFVD